MSWARVRRAGSEAKMGNVGSLCALGHSHASKLESSVCQMIQLREKAGDIKLVQIQAKVYLTDARIGYIPDFLCEELATGQPLYLEAKGYANDTWPIKKKLWRFYGPGPLEIWTGTHLRPVLDEVIIPVVRDMLR